MSEVTTQCPCCGGDLVITLVCHEAGPLAKDQGAPAHGLLEAEGETIRPPSERFVPPDTGSAQDLT